MTDIPLIYPNWSAPKNVIAYTTTRTGGVSEGQYASFNLAYHVQDNRATVAQNRTLLPHADDIQWMQQVHGNQVISITKKQSQALQCDALFTRQAGVFCAVMTADCIPILLTSDKGDEVACVHAGWKGLAKEVLKNTIAQFSCNNNCISAWIGPAISAQCYEVDEKIKRQFMANNSVFSANGNGRYQFDLVALAKSQLLQCGVENIYLSNLCTYTNSSTFFSYRRSTHRGEAECGRQVSVIGFR